MTDFLLELLSEEIPARMQERAIAEPGRLFVEAMSELRVFPEGLESWVTPRRLALAARGLPLRTPGRRETRRGPRVDAPAAAIEGFLRSTGLSRDQLSESVDDKGSRFLHAAWIVPGEPLEDALRQAIVRIVTAFNWPKSMRWGEASRSTESLRWIRPLRGIVAIFDGAVVDVEIAALRSCAATVGHRFHHPGRVAIGGADDYAARLRAAHVVLGTAERMEIIRTGADAAAAAAGLRVVPDHDLLLENAGLTEWPVPLLGSFDPAFLALPREVIQLSMRTNQKYFALTDAAGDLAPNFICTANIAAADGGAAIVAGNAKVLAARLADARFFWDQDRKVPLAEQAKKLDRIVFHEKLGTVADKVERVAKLARWLVEEGIVGGSPPRPRGEGRGEGSEAQPSSPAAGVVQPLSQPSPRGGEGSSLADMAEQAARLCKADLVTGMVGEFPELQGVIGSYYARAEGYPDTVADAIRDHYKPVGQGDEVPTAPVTVAVSLADKLDTLLGFFLADEPPTGSKDPYALRRSALAGLALEQVLAHGIHLGTIVSDVLPGFVAAIAERELGEANWPDAKIVVEEWLAAMRRGKPFQFTDNGALFVPNEGGGRTFFSDQLEPPYRYVAQLHQRLKMAVAFRLDRLKVQQREAGVRHDLIDAVFALGGEDDLVRLLARVKALQAFVATEDGANLLAGYRRAANIVRIETKKDADAGVTPPEVHDGGGYAPEPAEAALAAALDAAEPEAAAAVAAEQFDRAMQALARLRPAVDAFFDQVTVNDPDRDKRASRLALLDRIRVAVHEVADFSRIEG